MGVPKNFKDLRKLGVQNIAQYSAAIYGACFVSKFKHVILRFKLQTFNPSIQIQTFSPSIATYKHAILCLFDRSSSLSSFVSCNLGPSSVRAESDALTLFRNEMTTAADTGETSYKGMYGKF